MERLNHQRTMLKHHQLKNAVVDLSFEKEYSSITKSSKYLSQSMPVQQQIRESGLHLIKPSKPPQENTLFGARKKITRRKGKTPRTKRMKIASKTYSS